MDEKTVTRVYEADVLALPPLQMVLGSVPAPDPQQRRSERPEGPGFTRLPARHTAEMAGSVRRLIEYLEKKQ